MQLKSWFHPLFVGTIFIGVIAFYPWSWLGFSLAKSLFLSLGLALCFLIWAFKEKKGLIWKKEIKLVVLYFFLLALYTFFSITPLSSFLGLSGGQWGLMTQWLYFGVFLLAMNLAAENWKRMLLWLNVIVSIYALIQWAGLDPLQFSWQREAFLYRSFSVLGNPNWLASFLVLTFPVVFYQVGLKSPHKDKNHNGALWGASLTLLNALALVSTGSKAGFLAALFLAIFMLKGKTKHWKKGLIAFLVLLLGSLAYFYKDGWTLTRSLGSRMHIWKGAWQAFLDHPWGYGLDAFWAVFPSFSGPELWQTEGLNTLITHPHNIILEKLLEIGPWGLLLFGGMLFGPLKKAWGNSEQQCVSYGLIAYLITLLFGFETLGTGILFWLFLGSLFYAKKTEIKALPRWQNFTAGAFGLIFLAIGLINLQHAWANGFYEEGEIAKQKGGTGTALADFEKAIQLYSYDRVYLLASTELLLALQGEEARYLNQAEIHLNQLAKISHTKDPELSIFYAWLAAERGDTPEFKAGLKRAFLLNPASGNNYKIALFLYQKLGWVKEYEALKKEFYEKLPRYWNKPETTPGRIFQKNHGWVMEI